MNRTTGNPMSSFDSDRMQGWIEGWSLVVAILAFVGAVYVLGTADAEEWDRDRGCQCECGQ